MNDYKPLLRKIGIVLAHVLAIIACYIGIIVAVVHKEYVVWAIPTLATMLALILCLLVVIESWRRPS